MVKRLVLLALAFVMLADTADARLFRRRSSYSSSNVGAAWTGAVAIRSDDQAACERKASYMARHGIFGHGAGGLPVIGSFEGIGMGGPSCATCRPSWGATLTGDAEAAGNGTVYRVRSWR